MSPIKRGDIYYLYVPKQKGGVMLRTCGTGDARLYRQMKRMVAELKDGRRWKLLNAVTSKPQRLSLGTLYDSHVSNSLDALEASLSAEALAPHIAAYLKSCAGRGLDARNIENIERQLESFSSVATTTADITTATVTAWLASLTTSSGTRRQYLYAVTGFTNYLVDVGVLKDFPLARVAVPKKNPSRMTYHDAVTDETIVQAASTQYRALFAFIKATGVDVSVALATRARDLDLANGTARLKGTKTAPRDVHDGLIETWAIPLLTEHLHLHDVMAQGPNAHLWPDLTRSGAYHHHDRCCTKLGVEDYTLKDSRHSVAVRMAKAGYTAWEIAEQLGNSPEVVARVYARFIVKLSRRVTESVTQPSTEPTAT